VVYPTLQLLEDQGFARVRAEGDGKKTYEITDAGRAHLAENRDTVDSIFERVSKLIGHFLDEPMTAVHTAFRGVGKAAYSRATDAVQNPDVLKRIVEILDKAAAEIDAIPR
jgi:DNA-binding PadR family transcriptional regulator